MCASRLDKEMCVHLFNGIEHTAIAARDSQALADWYINLFGFRIVYSSGTNPPVYMLKAPDGTMLEILPAEGGQMSEYTTKQAGIRHLAFTVTDFAAAHHYLEKRGIVFFEIREAATMKLAFFRDPEGNILHLMWRPQVLD